MPDQVIRNAAATRLYTVTELASALGVTARALRFYEDKGLINPSRAGGARIYTHRDRARLQLILRGKRLGFTLRDIKEFLDLYDVDPGHHEQQRRLLTAVRKRIVHLSGMKDAITETLRELAEIERQVAASVRG
ncbi:MerR family transcriptional regulator [Lichenicoccus roseus]|uniref:MerR family DNA-binding transcriptional regulator n=1 Tax=Lichenicoccus roseus TaxID=2683649 RepID=A0A5R9J824_9PROT|nr:MerR family DNA-binding transcriptional regulator [Lichenicoccus roseus]TLU71771.1 MerR family DNA-binding transcriptional regulator [Lichenicoccus roseus]